MLWMATFDTMRSNDSERSGSAVMSPVTSATLPMTFSASALRRVALAALPDWSERLQMSTPIARPAVNLLAAAISTAPRPQPRSRIRSSPFNCKPSSTSAQTRNLPHSDAYMPQPRQKRTTEEPMSGPIFPERYARTRLATKTTAPKGRRVGASMPYVAFRGVSVCGFIAPPFQPFELRIRYPKARLARTRGPQTLPQVENLQGALIAPQK